MCTAAESCESFAARMGRQELDGFERVWNARMTPWMRDGLDRIGHGVHWTEGVEAMRFYAETGGREDELI